MPTATSSRADHFCAADCIMGHNIVWARTYGMCTDEAFRRYHERIANRPAFQRAYADAVGYTLEIPAEKRAAYAGSFTA